MKALLIISLFCLAACALPADYPYRPWHYSFSPCDDSVYVRKSSGWVLMSVDSTGVDWTAYQKHRDSIKKAKKEMKWKH